MVRNYLTMAGLALLIIHLEFFAARAQSDSRKLEIAGQFTILHLKEPIPRASNLCFASIPLEPEFSRNITGFGGHASYRVTSKFALDGEVSYFPVKPQEHFIQSDPRWQGLIGAKTGLRKKKFMVFGKARPGFLYFNGLSRITSVDQQFLAPFGCVSQLIGFADDRKAVFNLDIGGGAEFYLPKRIYLRVDAGDTVIHYPTKTPTEFNHGFTTHNFQVSAGIGIRF